MTAFLPPFSFLSFFTRQHTHFLLNFLFFLPAPTAAASHFIFPLPSTSPPGPTGKKDAVSSAHFKVSYQFTNLSLNNSTFLKPYTEYAVPTSAVTYFIFYLKSGGDYGLTHSLANTRVTCSISGAAPMSGNS